MQNIKKNQHLVQTKHFFLNSKIFIQSRESKGDSFKSIWRHKDSFPGLIICPNFLIKSWKNNCLLKPVWTFRKQSPTWQTLQTCILELESTLIPKLNRNIVLFWKYYMTDLITFVKTRLVEYILGVPNSFHLRLLLP